MRLNSIKLAGFKSFAEPTNFVLSSQLVGVVGPNGCGKSNIMDAVRWVLGAGRKAELRVSDSLDVIFNGTTSRNPAGRASVELVFDNSDHRAGGPWRPYSEIAVKRVISRDKEGSTYFINGKPVRERDVRDAFLGTGLGARGYAIIGQGTINQYIESDPQKMRLFLEEAAGVSKYKERRHDTEARLRTTRENLEQVSAFMAGLLEGLAKLEKQAEVAQRYHVLNEAATLRQHQLWWLKKRDADADLASIREQGLQALNAVEEKTAQLRHMEADMEQVREQHQIAGDALNQAQLRVYEATALTARLEEKKSSIAAGRSREQQRAVQIAEQIAQWQSRQTQAQQDIEHLAISDAQAREHAEFIAAQLEEYSERLPTLQTTLDARRAQANEQRNAVSRIQQQIQVLAVQQRNFNEQAQQQQLRLAKLEGEGRNLAGPEEGILEQLRSQYASAAEAAEIALARLEELQDAQPQLEDTRRTDQAELDTQAQRLTEVSARLQALRALQDKLKAEGKLQPWLQAQGLDGLASLWTRITVAAGWETALEAALRERLSALETARLETVQSFGAGSAGVEPPPARLTFFARPDAAMQPRPKTAFSVLGDSGALPLFDGANVAALTPMLELVQCSDAGLRAVLAHWLDGIWTAPSLERALAQRSNLAAGQAIYVAAGHSVSAHSLSFYAADSAQAGMLARAQEIEQLDKQQRAQQLLREQAAAALNRSEAACAEAARQLHAVREQSGAARERAHQLQVQLVQLQQQADAARARQQQIQADADEIREQIQSLQIRAEEAAAQFETLDMQLADAQELHAQLEDQTIAAERALAEAREQQRTLERSAEQARFGQQSLQAKQAEFERVIATAAEQIQALHTEQVRSSEELGRMDEAAIEAELQDALALQSERQTVVGQMRSQHDALAQQLREHEQARAEILRTIKPMEARIQELALKEQAASLGGEQFDKALAEAGADIEAIAQSVMDGGVRLHGLQGEIDRLRSDIAALGAVNLAAVQELEAAQQRRAFLDAQTADLTQAMQTLEAAIERIDAETRALLMSTFETVNGHFGRLFPQLFGGGQARLIMTGEEVLEAGVQVMAQPPGKKNQTIQLLSGGEKALTAIALVFAIFQLNPAPFCLLDEVDAPLDDANTERYARLVASMSASTQFLFISHNKIAMEMAQQLIGVTMQERGVSRIVAVDMARALTMTQRS